MSDETLTPRQVAEELGVTVRTVQRWIAAGRLPGRRVGGRLRVSRSSLEPGADRSLTPVAPRPIRSLLVANRGEVAARVARSGRSLGMRIIGMRTNDERGPSGADETHVVGSYLDADAILAIARRTGAGAVHPGYGFLAESPEFADRVAQAGITWVGPPSAAIAVMGDKAASRRRVAELGVPVVDGYDGDAQDDAALRAAARRIGYPLLVKPTAGGGGKGMRTVRAPDELVEALAGARRDARRAFGDERVVLERLVEGGRHVEIQVLFDAEGSGVHLGERDCSAQRRRQKIVEEAPAPSVSDELRSRLADAALAVAASVAYRSAGTVEFLVDREGGFHFLEMNTRLQVEHPVTELVTGRDLVADQLRIAQGETLSALGLEGPPRLRGHAIEARVYAEEPESGFLPATGRVALLRWPSDVRIDADIAEGDEVTDRFDPMLAKLIAHGRDRAEALARLRSALDRTTLLGVRSNIRFLRWLLAREPMTSGGMRTDTIDRLTPPAGPDPSEEHWQAAASALAAKGETADPWSGPWRLNAPATLRLVSGPVERRIEITATAADATVTVVDDVAYVDVEGQSVEFSTAHAPAAGVAGVAAGAEGGSALTAPMPGRVIAVHAREGATVTPREALVVIEAMKMEHAVSSPVAGTVRRVLVEQGQQVQRGDQLVEVEGSGPPTMSS